MEPGSFWLEVAPTEEHASGDSRSEEVVAGLAVLEDLGLVTAKADVADRDMMPELGMPAIRGPGATTPIVPHEPRSRDGRAEIQQAPRTTVVNRAGPRPFDNLRSMKREPRLTWMRH